MAETPSPAASRPTTSTISSATTRPAKGKGLRPGLLLAAADACGASTRTALPAAAALELLHTAFLIHDDVEDHSRLRRGRPTLHELHGAALAINAGDALANLAVRSR